MCGVSGPDITIATREPLSAAVLDDITAYLTGPCGSEAVPARCEQFAMLVWDVHVEPKVLDVVGPWQDSPSYGARRIELYLCGQGHGDGCDGFYEQGRFVHPEDWPPLLGFTPANTISVLTSASRQPDHLIVARLSADIVDITSGVAVVALHHHQIDTVRQLPGLLAVDVDEDWAEAVGGSDFLRAFAATPGFRLRK